MRSKLPHRSFSTPLPILFFSLDFLTFICDLKILNSFCTRTKLCTKSCLPPKKKKLTIDFFDAPFSFPFFEKKKKYYHSFLVKDSLLFFIIYVPFLIFFCELKFTHKLPLPLISSLCYFFR